MITQKRSALIASTPGGEQVLYLEGEVLDLKGQLADMEEIKGDLEGHIADLSQELAAARKAAETQASERGAALQV